MFSKIIVICAGNICRSPIAEAVLRKKIGKPDIQVASAGVVALVNHPADPMAREVALEHGYDISAHRAQQATQPLLSSMDLILTLDQTHSEWIRSRFPALYGRVHKLGRWQANVDVEDPYRLPKSAFQRAYDDIDRFCSDWATRIS
jgi:protein-tyrosine phosphatase